MEVNCKYSMYNFVWYYFILNLLFLSLFGWRSSLQAKMGYAMKSILKFPWHLLFSFYGFKVNWELWLIVIFLFLKYRFIIQHYSITLYSIILTRIFTIISGWKTPRSWSDTMEEPSLEILILALLMWTLKSLVFLPKTFQNAKCKTFHGILSPCLAKNLWS
jgi:hypothetical protein